MARLDESEGHMAPHRLLKRLQNDLNMNHENFARHVGISPSALSRALNGITPREKVRAQIYATTGIRFSPGQRLQRRGPAVHVLLDADADVRPGTLLDACLCHEHPLCQPAWEQDEAGSMPGRECACSAPPTTEWESEVVVPQPSFVTEQPVSDMTVRETSAVEPAAPSADLEVPARVQEAATTTDVPPTPAGSALGPPTLVSQIAGLRTLVESLPEALLQAALVAGQIELSEILFDAAVRTDRIRQSLGNAT
jgi:hypothetical protein